MSESIGINPPTPSSTIADPATGVVTRAWWYALSRLVIRTGGVAGINSSDIQTSAVAALAAAEAAQSTATLSLMEDDDTFALAIPRIANLSVALAMSDEPEPVDTDSIVLLSLALQDSFP